MLSDTLKRIFSFALALMLAFSLVPVSAFAAEEEVHDHAAPESHAAPVVAENPEIDRFQAVIDDMLAYYLGTADLTPEEVLPLAEAMDEYALSDAAFEILILTEDMQYAMDDALVTEAELEQLVSANSTFMAFNNYVMDNAELPDVSFLKDETYTPVTGVSVAVAGATSNKIENGKVTVTAKGVKGTILNLWNGSTKTATITVTNTSDGEATVGFAWTATSVNELKIDGKQYTGTSGNFSKALAAGGSFTITVKTAEDNTENKLEMSGFTCAGKDQKFDLTIENDGNGSLTAGGTTITSTQTIQIGAEGVELKATGSNFVAWVSSDGKILTTDPTYKVAIDKATTVKVVFTTEACFKSDSNDFYRDLTAATASGVKKFTLMNNGTLKAGKYTIPSGVTMLIPYDAAGTVRTKDSGWSDEGDNGPANHEKATIYRTLTMADGAHITVNGELNVSGGSSADQQCNGAPGGPQGVIDMKSGSSITVEKDAVLSAWGFIAGSGTVEVKNGGTVHELFQIRDWRGGNATSSMKGKSERVFPLSQYFVQNVQVPMTLHAGAKEIVTSAVSVTLIGIQKMSVEFIGPNGLFKITSGSVTKDYDEANDRLIIDLDGEMALSNFSLSVHLGLAGNFDIDTKDYIFPITNNFTVNFKNGSKVSINQDLEILPGAVLNIEKGATVTMAKGNKVIVYDSEDWGGYCGEHNATHLQVVYAHPNMPVTRSLGGDAQIKVAGTLDLSAGYLYTTAKGAAITGVEGGVIKTQSGTDTKTYQASQSGKDISYVKIDITPAKLQNADGSYTAINKANNLGGVFTYTNGSWAKTECFHAYTEAITKEATCTAPGVKTLTCPCGDSYTEEIKVKDHTPGAAATCTTAQTCTVCGETLTAALGHSTDKAGDKAATCTAKAYCSVCQTYYGEIDAANHAQPEEYTYEKIDETNHKKLHACCRVEVGVEAHTYADGSTICTCGHQSHTCSGTLANGQAPDCTNDGWKDYATCSCGKYYSDAACKNQITDLATWKTGDGKINASGHSMTYHAEESATCGKEGTLAHYACDKCKKNFADEPGATELTSLVIPKLTTHTPKADDGDCTTEVTCSVCGAVTTAANATHTGGTATCTEQAVCSVCSKPYGTKLNHSMTEHPAQAATCVKTGNYAYWDCSTCDPMYKDANGSEAYADNGWIIPKDLENGHAWSVTYSFADDGSACTATHVCGNDASHNVTIHATITPEVIKAPNCTEKGTTKYTATFAEDWAVAQTKEVEVAALGHTFINEVEFKEPTCTEDGNQAYKQCETCDLYFADNAQKYDEGGQEDNSSFTISSRGGHDYSTQAFDTTHHWIECSVCGEPNETTMVEHSFTSKASDKEASAATCTANQFVYVQCDNCEAVSGSLTVEVADTKLGHNWTDATCAAPKTCSVCGETEGTATGEHLDANSDNKCDDCGAAITAYQIESYASSLLMKGMIHVKQYWKFIGLTEEQVKSGNAYMKVTEVDGDTYTVDLEWYKNDYANGMTIFSAPSNGIPAKNLGENLSMQAFVEVDGVVYESAIRDYGVLTYAENMMKKDNEALKSALVALLNYGAAAQIDLGYKTDDLANKDLQRYVDEFGLNPAYLDLGWTDDYLTSVVEPSEAMTVNFAPTGTVTSAAKSLYLKGAISVNYYVTVGKDKTKFANSTATMYFWTAEQYAKLAKAGTALTKENASYFVTNDKLAYNSNAKLQYYYTFLSDQIPAKNFGDTIYAVMCVTDSDGVEHCSEMILYSPEVYAANKINNGKVETVDDVAKWMVVYGERAKLALA